MSGAGADPEIWLIRHAESAWNAAGRWQGQADPALSERGREQAASLARRIAGERFALLVSSDLVRARETAHHVARAAGLALRFEVRLRERDAGLWAGLTRAEIAARWPEDLARVGAHDADARPAGGESLREAAARARGFFRELASEQIEGPVAVVTHGGVIRALCGVGPLRNASVVRVSLAALVARER